MERSSILIRGQRSERSLAVLLLPGLFHSKRESGHRAGGKLQFLAIFLSSHTSELETCVFIIVPPHNQHVFQVKYLLVIAVAKGEAPSLFLPCLFSPGSGKSP